MRTKATSVAFVMATVTATVMATATACGSHAGVNEAPSVGRVALQNDIAERLTASGDVPRSVTCQEDLVGEVGRIAHCDVVMSDVDSFQPVVTVTEVDGDRVDYELTPALSQAQLERVVSRLVIEASGEPVQLVACESGLEGTVGAVAHCDVDAGGVQARRAVEVTGVSGLTMDFNLLSN